MERLPAPDLPPWMASEVPFTRYRVAVDDGLAMHVMETGRGRPVLMVHGNPTWGFLYRKVAMSLQGQGLRVIMPDLIGFGFSDKPRDFAAHSIRNHSRWLGSLIDQLDLEDAIIVVQDWGGAIGTHPFTTRPERLGGMVVLNTVLDAPPANFKPTPFHRFSHVPVLSDLAFRALPLPQAALHLAQGDKSSIRGNVARAYRYPFRHIRDRVAPLATARMAVDRPGHPSIPALDECAAFVRGFDGPKAMVWGRRDPVLARALKRTKALLGDPPVTETQAGHFLQEEVPDEIAAAVRDVHQRLSRGPTDAAEQQA
ncbi:MAG: alpha/beta fold hydrolase [Myxococcota bacterium]